MSVAVFKLWESCNISQFLDSSACFRCRLPPFVFLVWLHIFSSVVMADNITTLPLQLDLLLANTLSSLNEPKYHSTSVVKTKKYWKRKIAKMSTLSVVLYTRIP